MTKKPIDKKIMTYGSVTLILSILAIALRTVCLFTSYDAYIGYYKEGFITSALNAFLVISAIYFISARFTIKNDVYTASGKEINLFLRIAGLLVAATFFYTATSILSGQFAEGAWYVTTLAVVSFIASIYFILKFLDVKLDTAHGLLGFAVIIYCILVVLVTYFDILELLNGPNKIMVHLALISIALFMLAEIRAYVGEIEKGYYVASLCASTFFTGACSIPALIFYFSRDFENSYYIFHVVIAGMFLYLLARLISFVLASAEPEVMDDEEQAPQSEELFCGDSTVDNASSEVTGE